jgi:hypothetical protein
MRRRLSNRRESRTETILVFGQQLHVTVGFDPDGTALEVFARCARPDSDVDTLADDVAVLLSRELQFGDSLDAIYRSLGKERGVRPLSLVAEVVAATRRIVAEVRQ